MKIHSFAKGSSQARGPDFQVKDGEWFFDTELLLVAEEQGYRVSEVPVDWIEDLDSRVDVASAAIEDTKGLLRVRAERLRRLSGQRRRDAAPPWSLAGGRGPRQVVSSAKTHRQVSARMSEEEQPPQ